MANHGTGSVASLLIKEDGSSSEASAFVQHQGEVADKVRQGGPHAHSVNLPKSNRFMLVTDLGLDKVFVYRFDAAKGSPTPNDPPFAKVDPRSGPRHFVFHPSEKFAYIINEISCNVTAFRYDAAKGTLQNLQTISTLPKDFTGQHLSTAEIAVDRKGRFLYGSNRGHDSIAVFAIDQQKGTLTLVEITPTGGQDTAQLRDRSDWRYICSPRTRPLEPSCCSAHRPDDRAVLLRRARRWKLAPPVSITFLAAKQRGATPEGSAWPCRCYLPHR